MKWNSEFLRSTKVRLGALVVALAGISFRYAESWFFDPPEVVQEDLKFSDHWSNVRTSTSAARVPVGRNQSQWKIAIATNRGFANDNPIVPVGMTRIRDQVHGVVELVPETTYGFSDVYVPLKRKRGEFSLDVRQPEHVQPEDLHRTDSTQFFAGVKQILDASQVSEVMVFVHGFNVTLEQATARAAQLAEDMPFHGVMIAYSWASAAQETGYGSDAIVAERYFWNLAALLADLRTQLPKKTRLHVLAHSMGNRVTLRALNALAGTIGPHGEGLVLNPDRTRERFAQWGTWAARNVDVPPIANLVLAAPDVEVHEFEKFVASIRHTTNTMVLYASNSDMALEGSLHYNGEGHRAGDSRAHVHVDGLRIIHVSGVNRLDPLGHSYYGSNPGVLDQLARLLRPATVPETVSAAVSTGVGPARTSLR